MAHQQQQQHTDHSWRVEVDSLTSVEKLAHRSDLPLGPYHPFNRSDGTAIQTCHAVVEVLTGASTEEISIHEIRLFTRADSHQRAPDCLLLDIKTVQNELLTSLVLPRRSDLRRTQTHWIQEHGEWHQERAYVYAGGNGGAEGGCTSLKTNPPMLVSAVFHAPADQSRLAPAFEMTFDFKFVPRKPLSDNGRDAMPVPHGLAHQDPQRFSRWAANVRPGRPASPSPSRLSELPQRLDSPRPGSRDSPVPPYRLQIPSNRDDFLSAPAQQR